MASTLDYIVSLGRAKTGIPLQASCKNRNVNVPTHMFVDFLKMRTNFITAMDESCRGSGPSGEHFWVISKPFEVIG